MRVLGVLGSMFRVLRYRVESLREFGVYVLGFMFRVLRFRVEGSCLRF